MQPNLERPGDELMLQRRRKFDDHVARRTNIAFGDPSPSEQAPTAFHIARKTHAPVGSAPTLDAQHAAAIERGEAAMDQWMTSSQIAQAGGAGGDDDVGKVKKWRAGKKAVKPAFDQSGTPLIHRSGVIGAAREDRSTSAMNDPALQARLAEGTWKSAGHVPGYAGHVPMGQPALQPGEGRSLDKSEALFKDNYKAAYDGYRGVSKLVPPQ